MIFCPDDTHTYSLTNNSWERAALLSIVFSLLFFPLPPKTKKKPPPPQKKKIITTEYTYIGRHDGSGLKVDSLDIGLDSSHLLDGHVGQSLQLKGHNHRDGKRRLDRGFVPARERLASITGLELSHGHVLCLAFLVLVLRAIESIHPVVDLAIEFNFENCGSLGQGVGELECCNLVFGSIDRRRLVTNIR